MVEGQINPGHVLWIQDVLGQVDIKPVNTLQRVVVQLDYFRCKFVPLHKLWLHFGKYVVHFIFKSYEENFLFSVEVKKSSYCVVLLIQKNYKIRN